MVGLKHIKVVAFCSEFMKKGLISSLVRSSIFYVEN
jgi:hypothetical protein